MARPRMIESEKHTHEFRLRLQEDDAILIRGLSKKLGIKPAELIRVMVRSKLASKSAIEGATLQSINIQ
jgi:hypothetical protein